MTKITYAVIESIALMIVNMPLIIVKIMIQNLLLYQLIIMKAIRANL